MLTEVKINGINNFFKNNPNEVFIVTVISMGQPSQTETRFESFIKRLNRIKHKPGVTLLIILTDFLQRHYIGLDKQLSFSDIRKKIFEIGSDWIMKNKKTLSFKLNLEIDFEILHWRRLIEYKEFKSAFAKVERLYRTDVIFKQIVDELSKIFADKLFCRYSKIENPPSFDDCFNAARKYLLEESAIWGPLLEKNLDFITYPGAKNKAVEYTYIHLFESKNHFLPWLRYSFIKKGDAIPDLSGKLELRSNSMDVSFFSSCEKETEKKSKYNNRRHTL